MNDTKSTGTAAERNSSLSRRGFLSLPLCAAGLAAPGLARATSALLNPAALEGGAVTEDLVSIGYQLGSDAIPDLHRWTHTAGEGLLDGCGRPLDAERCLDLQRHRVVDARALPAGDARFVGGAARVTVHGMHATRRGAVDTAPSLALDVPFPHAPSVPFQAWRYDAGATGGATPGATFEVPVTANSGLTLRFRLEGGAPPVEAHITAGLTTGVAKLRRGVYLIAWRAPDAPRLPSWSEHQVLEARRDTWERTDAEGNPTPESPNAGDLDADAPRSSRLASRWLDATPAEMVYLAVSVDFAGDASEALV